jgi:hypothetical protein
MQQHDKDCSAACPQISAHFGHIVTDARWPKILPQGVIAACGPGFKADELVFGARLLDIAPTVLHYFGLPVGEDMEGRVLEDAFTERRPVATRPTWENPDAPRQTRAESGPGADKALLEQFVALGYIDEIPDDPGQAKAETERENESLSSRPRANASASAGARATARRRASASASASPSTSASASERERESDSESASDFDRTKV